LLHQDERSQQAIRQLGNKSQKYCLFPRRLRPSIVYRVFIEKHVTNIHATELRAVSIAMVQRVKLTIEHAYEKNTSWQS